MKKIFITLTCAFSTLMLVAQSQKSISSDQGSLTVITDAQTQKDYIEFSLADWNNITQGTNYTVSESSFPIGIRICIRIASRKKNCDSGIGFRCGLVECTPIVPESSQTNLNGQKADRTYSASYTRNGDTVVLNFNEKVDWDWLAN